MLINKKQQKKQKEKGWSTSLEPPFTRCIFSLKKASVNCKVKNNIVSMHPGVINGAMRGHGRVD